MIASPEAAKEFLDKLNEKKNENASINLEVVKNSFEAELGKLSKNRQFLQSPRNKFECQPCPSHRACI